MKVKELIKKLQGRIIKMNAKELTNHELAVLIAKRKEQIIIFTGIDGNHCVTPDIVSVTMNGNAIQINTKLVCKRGTQ